MSDLKKGVDDTIDHKIHFNTFLNQENLGELRFSLKLLREKINQISFEYGFRCITPEPLQNNRLYLRCEYGGIPVPSKATGKRQKISKKISK